MFFPQNDPGLFLAIRKHDPYDGQKKLKHRLTSTVLMTSAWRTKNSLSLSHQLTGVRAQATGLSSAHVKKVFRGTTRSYLNGCFKFLVHFVPFRGD